MIKKEWEKTAQLKPTNTDKKVTPQEADKQLLKAVEEKRKIDFEMNFSDWSILSSQIANYLQLPTFVVQITKWLQSIDNLTYQHIFNSQLSWVVRLNYYAQVFRKDLIMDVIICVYGTQIPEQFRGHKPFGGDEFYFKMKDAWFQGKFNGSFLMKELKETIKMEKSTAIQDPQLPFASNFDPQNVRISMVNNKTLILQIKEQLINIDISKQIGLQGTKGFWNKKSQKGNKNWDILTDVFCHPDNVLDMNGTGYSSFPTGMSKIQRDKSSKSVSGLKSALDFILELNSGKEWFTKKETVYEPNFRLGSSYIDAVRKAVTENEPVEYDPYSDNHNVDIYDSNGDMEGFGLDKAS